MKRKIIIIISIIILGIFWCILIDQKDVVRNDFSRGLQGKTVIVSLFLDDINCYWDKESEDLKRKSLDYLGIASKWIEKKASIYNSSVSIIYDWTKDKELYFEAYVDTDIMNEAKGHNEKTYEIINRIDSDSLIEKYKADHIVYMVFINTPRNNSTTSYTYCDYLDDDVEYEICYILMNVDNEIECPAAIAHELLHTYGAPDLYIEDTDNTNYGITKEYVTYLEKTNSNDIMYITYDNVTAENHYDQITNDFTELDAYYVGLTNKSEDVEKWRLGVSQHSYND